LLKRHLTREKSTPPKDPLRVSHSQMGAESIRGALTYITGILHAPILPSSGPSDSAHLLSGFQTLLDSAYQKWDKRCGARSKGCGSVPYSVLFLIHTCGSGLKPWSPRREVPQQVVLDTPGDCLCPHRGCAILILGGRGGGAAPPSPRHRPAALARQPRSAESAAGLRWAHRGRQSCAPPQTGRAARSLRS